ncbi:hypothetical protein P4H94_26890 [Paenibacillus macerans]|uniref:Uncharacterized protein n=1 Tax=Paenibacillus macerans TaxID=44252 RepID=A0A090ZLW4_PAEMA|nr:DUF6550 family protein [Paenibacillus macerans]KFN12379.1 hypothetical protein DJ90_2030 [Paenibacillus macerans]MBS5913511.1 hypothetical protein [Paenibacillus macerans]MCY7558476.1 hypothetical protein [Paenibacillus macerans]MDU5948725.1 DUF6550 family protein [Paenibacillus macerans]MEC0140474.1 hypothetical protein [Paenibacillus macerans]
MKRKVWLVTGGIVVLGAIGIWAMGLSSDKPVQTEPVTNATPSPSVPTPIVIPEDSTSNSPETEQPSSLPKVSDVKPEQEPTITESPILQPEKGPQHIEVPITEPESTPKPTKPPKSKPQTTDKPQSPVSPSKNDDQETKPSKPKEEPKVGEQNSSGKVYFPGFGWVEKGEPNQGSKSESDGDWDKQVGTMD